MLPSSSKSCRDSALRRSFVKTCFLRILLSHFGNFQVVGKSHSSLARKSLIVCCSYLTKQAQGCLRLKLSELSENDIKKSAESLWNSNVDSFFPLAWPHEVHQAKSFAFVTILARSNSSGIVDKKEKLGVKFENFQILPGCKNDRVLSGFWRLFGCKNPFWNFRAGLEVIRRHWTNADDLDQIIDLAFARPIILCRRSSHQCIC